MGKVLQFITSPLSIIDKDLGKGAQAVGLIVLGAATGNFALVAAGVASGASLFKKPALSGSAMQRLNASLVTDAPRKIAFGRTALNTDLRYQEWWGGEQEYCSQVFVLASHHCEAVEEVWLDDKLAWSADRGVLGEYVGYLVVVPRPQAQQGNVFRTGWSGRWGANASFAGCATLYLQFKVTGNGKKGKSPFSTSITSRVTVVGKGALLPDPRFDATSGGSGPVRIADQSTWAWAPSGYEAGRNPALALLFYLIGWRIQNPATGEWKLAVGRGVPVDRIDLGSFMTAANICDEIVQRANGTTEPRYRCDGTVSEADDPPQVIASLEASMNAKLRDSAGRFALQVLHNDLATPVVDFTDDDVLGDFTWTAGNDLNDRRNVVRGRYTDPGSLYQLVDFPQVRLGPVDGIDRIDSIDLALVQSPSQAQRLSRQRLQRQQYQGTFAAEFNARGWAVKDGDIVRLTFAALGFDRKLFRVSEGLIDPTGVVPLALVEENAAIYAWDRSEAPAVVAAEPNQFNPLLAPLIVAIDEAGMTAEWPAITGEGKPDDNATNSADPNSPFGPGGTVGGTITKLTEAEQIAQDARTRTMALETQTIPAINQAVADAGDRIAATRQAADDGLAAANKKLDDASTRLDGEDAAIRQSLDQVVAAYQAGDTAVDARVSREVATLVDADAALSRRIDSVAAAGGYDDTPVYAEVRRVDQAGIDRDGATARRIDTVVSDYKAADVAANGRIDQVAASAADANRSVATLADSVNTRFGGVNTTLGSYDQRITALSNDQAGYVSRILTMESQWRGETDSPVLARIRATETAVSDGRFATAQRASDIEASLGNARGRLSVVETATTDGRFATAQRAEQIASYAGGIGATVDQQSGAIANLNGKTAAYVRFITTAGNNRAQLTLTADANGGAGVDLVGDLSVSGNVLVSGTIVTDKLVANAITSGASVIGGDRAFSNNGATAVAQLTYSVSRSDATIRVDVSGFITLGASSAAGTAANMTIAAGNTTLVGPVRVAGTRGTVVPFSFAVPTSAVAGPVTFSLYLQATNSAGSGDPHTVSSPTIIVQEFKR